MKHFNGRDGEDSKSPSHGSFTNKLTSRTMDQQRLSTKHSQLYSKTSTPYSPTVNLTQSLLKKPSTEREWGKPYLGEEFYIDEDILEEAMKDQV